MDDHDYVTTDNDYFNPADKPNFYVAKGEIMELPPEDEITPLIERGLEQGLIREPTREELAAELSKEELEAINFWEEEEDEEDVNNAEQDEETEENDSEADGTESEEEDDETENEDEEDIDYESYYDEEAEAYVTPEGKEYQNNNVYFQRQVREDLGIEEDEE